MAMNLARTGVSAVVGVGSAVLQEKTTPLMLGTTAISWGTVEEAAALLVGGGMQLFAPHTMPDVADGLVDGSIALLAARGTRYALTSMGGAAPYAVRGAQAGYPQRVGTGAYAAPLDGGRPMAGARPQIGNVPVGSRRVKLG